MAGTHPIITAPAAENAAIDDLLRRVLAEHNGNGKNAADVGRMVYRPNWGNKPFETEPVITIDGGRVGSAGNMMLVIAAPGFGKSAICEAVVASKLSPNCDSLGLHVQTNKIVAYLDTERSKADHWRAWHRTMRRAGIPENAEPIGIKFELVSGISKIEDRRAYLWEHFTDKTGLIILDGLADFVLNVNDPEECNEFLFELLARAKEFEISLLSTLHHNPQPGSEKGRGHLGSEAQRRSESVLLLKRDAAGTRTLTMDFQFGKNRNDVDSLETHFSWDIGKEMFTSCETEAAYPKPEVEKKYTDLLAGLPDKPMSFGEVVQALQRVTGGSADAAKSRFQRLKKGGGLVKNGHLWQVSR